MKYFKNVFILILIFLQIFIISGCNKKEDNSIKYKIKEEMNYLDTQIITMLNGLNNISFENYIVSGSKVEINEEQSSGNPKQSTKEQNSSEKSESNNSTSSSQSEEESSKVIVYEMKPSTVLLTNKNDIKWDNIKLDIGIINSSWNSIVLDLYKLDISDEDILEFSRNLDNAIVSIKNENKLDSLNSLAKLYEHIPKYLEKIKEKDTQVYIKKVKLNLIQAYALIEEKNWKEVNNKLSEAENNFNNVKSSNDLKNKKEYIINKIDLMIKEMKSSITKEDENIFYIKYISIMKELGNL